MLEPESVGVDLLAAKIGDQLAMIGSVFESRLEMDSVTVGSSLFMRRAKLMLPANLAFINVGSNLDVRGSTLKELDLTSARIEGELALGSPDWNIKWRIPAIDRTKRLAPKLTLRNARVGVLQDTMYT